MLPAALRRLSLFAGLTAVGYRLWYELAVIERNPFYVPPSGRYTPDAQSLLIDWGDLALRCLAYFAAVWIPIQIVAWAASSGSRRKRNTPSSQVRP